MPKTLIEPFRIKSVEPIRMTTRAERERLLDGGEAERLPAPGRGRAPRLAHRLRHRRHEHRAVGGHHAGRRELRRRPQLLPAGGGGAGPHRLRRTSSPPTRGGRPSGSSSATVCKPGHVVPSNCHFDTTRASSSANGAEARDLVIPEGLEPAHAPPVQGEHRPRPGGGPPRARGRPRPLRHDHVTNNTGGGQPVSLENLRAYADAPAPPRQAARPRRLPLRRERHVREDARAGLRGRAGEATSPRRCSRWPTAAP